MGLLVYPMGMDLAEFFGSPAPLATLPSAGDFSALAIQGNTVLMALKGGGVELADFTQPAAPLDLSIIKTSQEVHALAVVGKDALTSGSSGPLHALGSSESIQSDCLPDAPTGFATAGRRLYIATSHGLYATTAGRAEASSLSVQIGNFFFTPSSLQIQQGDDVKWTWTGGTHSTTSGQCSAGACGPDGLWDSGVKSSGNFDHVFSSAGIFPYHCAVHLSAMTGTVTVLGSGGVLQATSQASRASGPPPLSVSFTGSATGGQSPYSYSWNFGDGGASTDQNPTHVYTVAGTYSATLAMTDSASATASASPIAITVSSGAQPPTISTVRKVSTGGFSLRVDGTNFQQGSTVTINGTAAPQTLYKKPTKVLASGGAALKAMLPLGVQVQVQVRNPDGTTSQSFAFTRTKGGAGYGGG